MIHCPFMQKKTTIAFKITTMCIVYPFEQRLTHSKIVKVIRVYKRDSPFTLVFIMPELKTMDANEENQVSSVSNGRKCFNHSIYDWLTLLSTLFVPLVVGILTVVLPLQQQNLSEKQNENSKVIALNNRLQELELLHDQQKQVILNTYEHDLCELMFKYKKIVNKVNESETSKVINSGEEENEKKEMRIKKEEDDDDDERVSLVIRTKTLHALRQLDPARKILLIELLIDSGVQNRINISHADFSSLVFPPGSFYDRLRFVNVIARKISLKHVHLHQSNFSYSILDESSFQQSNCSQADFTYASLQRTDWTNTDVTQAIFNYSNLLGAKITSQQLATVQGLRGAILPNGSTSTI